MAPHQLSEAAHLLKAVADSALKLQVGQDQINTQRHKYLCHHRIVGIANKCFDL